MANVEMIINVSPIELQLLDEALRMYVYALRSFARENGAHPLSGYKFDLSLGDGNSSKVRLMANVLRRNIGLK